MALDMAKYTRLFLEEAAEHLTELGAGLLALEKDAASTESIDLVFRMAHSVKSMAASLAFDSISETAHRLEDRMQTIRSAGRISSPGELGVLFRALESLERMVEHVRVNGEAPPPDPELEAALSRPAPEAEPAERPPQKKVLS